MIGRMEKVNELIGQEVAKELQRLLPEFFITITEVEVSRDLGYAKIWITSLGEDDETLKACNEVASEAQAKLAQKLTMRKTPKLRFHIDKRERHAQKIEELINEIKRDGDKDEA